MTENQQFIYDSVFAQVRMGFLSQEEIKDNIAEEIEDNGFAGEISEAQAGAWIQWEQEKLMQESMHWEKPTDTDKLIKAFDELCRMNIIALHNAGYTNSDGEYEVVEIERVLREKGFASDGYCFYHEQNLLAALLPENPCLHIAFQKIDNSDDAVTIAVGRKVADTLKRNGLQVTWNGAATTKILLPGFRWQRLYDGQGKDLQEYDNVIAIMTR